MRGFEENVQKPDFKAKNGKKWQKSLIFTNMQKKYIKNQIFTNKYQYLQ